MKGVCGGVLGLVLGEWCISISREREREGFRIKTLALEGVGGMWL